MARPIFLMLGPNRRGKIFFFCLKNLFFGRVSNGHMIVTPKMNLRFGILLLLGISLLGATIEARHTFDYIVVGGGTAGCVAAARLSEDPTKRVLMLSNGEDQTGKIENTLPLIGGPPVPVPSDYVRYADVIMTTEGLTYGASGRKSSIALRPRLLGGGSSLNGGAFVRPDNSDYVRLATEFGLDHWSVAEIDAIWKKIETFIPEGSLPIPAGHGTLGPIQTRAVSPPGLLALYLAALQNVTGSVFNPDMGLGNVAGSGYTVRPLGGYANATSTGDYVRQDSYTKYIVPVLHRSNLVVRDRSTVVQVSGDRDCWDGRQRRPCFNKVTYFRDNEAISVKVKRGGEIILSAGALESAKILMQSGIGNCQELAERGIPCTQSIPYMAKRIREHIAFATSHYVFAPFPDWASHKGAMVSTYTSSRTDGKINLEITAVMIPGSPTTQALINQAVVTRTDSFGELTLKDADWLSPAKLSFGIFSNDSDRTALLHAVRKINEAINVTRIANNIPITAAPSDTPLPAENAADGDYLAWLKKYSVADYHTTSATPMGQCANGATVDQHLKVCGVSGLRVADNGVMPFAYTAHSTHSGALIIGEQVARFIKDF